MLPDHCLTLQAETMEAEKVELKVKPEEGVGKKRIAHEAKHLEVNVKNHDGLNCEYVQEIIYHIVFYFILFF